MEQKPKVLNASNKYLYAELNEKSKEMRLNLTEAEARLWERLRNKKMGVKFRRQHSIGNFIVDFYCIEKALVIEVDGDIHDLQKERDEERENILKNMGCKMLRFRNEQVLNDIESTLAQILTIIKSPPSP